MSRTTTDIVYNVTGQTLAYRVPQGLPTSATFLVVPDYANDDATAEFSGTATVDSVNTTTDAASGAGQADPTKINLTATTSIVIGRKYLLSVDSYSEWIEVVGIEAGQHVHARFPLKNTYATGATFVGATITAAVDATWVADEANISDHLDPNPDYRVRWSIVVSGTTYIAYTYFDLVRAAVTHQVDIHDLNERAPGLHSGLPTEYRIDQGRSLIDSAWRSVQAKLASLSIDTDSLRDDQITDELTILRALNMLAMGGWKPLGMTSDVYINETRTEYERFLEQHFQATLKHRLATGQSSGVEVVRAQPYWSK